MMGFANIGQVRELFLSCGMGFLLGAYYDVFRILRRVLRPGTIRVFWQDVLFFTTSALASFMFALAINDGVLRAYVLAGLVAGFFAYRYVVGRAVVRLATALIAVVLRCERSVNVACQKMLKKIQKNLKKIKKGLETEENGVV